MKQFHSLGAAPLFAFLLAGCPATPPSQTASTSTNPAKASAQTLNVISPHNPEIRNEFETLWKKSHPDTPIKWIDQGGSSDDLRFVREAFKSRTKAQGIGVDVFFGGGGETFAELQKDGLLVPIEAKSDVPAELNHVPLRAKDGTWIAAALSGFGILYNKKIAERDSFPVPQTWADLGNPKLQDRIELANPRKSGSAHVVYEIILQTNGWDKGWKILTSMAGNARRWTDSSTEPLQDVQNGEAAFCTAIDFYAINAIGQAGADKLAFVQPKGQNLITPDPIGILQGAPNAKAAQDFVAFVLSSQAQKLWNTRKGAPGGPTNATLSRLPASPSAYGSKDAFSSANPHKEKATVVFDSDKASRRRRALDDLIGTVLVDEVDALQTKWRKNPDINASGYVPMPEREFNALADKWSDAATISAQKQKWSEAAQKFFAS